MAPPLGTPNFSRPLPSAPSTSALDIISQSPKNCFDSPSLPNSASTLSFSSQASRKTRLLAKTMELAQRKDGPACVETVRCSNDTNTGKDSYRTTRLNDPNNDNRITGLNDPPNDCARDLSQMNLNSTHAAVGDSLNTNLSVEGDLGVVDKPILNFRPQLFKHLDRNRKQLNIDLFWPIKLDEEAISDDDDGDGDAAQDTEVFPFNELKPLMSFQNLHYLQLNGMMQSYQPIIWATVWLCPFLTDLHLEMALPPEILPDPSEKSFFQPKLIDHHWVYKPIPTYPEHEYIGDHGTGVLHISFGYGEYLDQQAMKAAQIEVATKLPVGNLRYLPLQRLTLMSFVIDAGPFFRWFSPDKFVELTLLGGCVDAGFALPIQMQDKVQVNGPKPPPAPMTMIRVKPGDVKLVDIKPRGPKGAKIEADKGGGGLKTKLSQMLPKTGTGKVKKQD